LLTIALSEYALSYPSPAWRRERVFMDETVPLTPNEFFARVDPPSSAVTLRVSITVWLSENMDSSSIGTCSDAKAKEKKKWYEKTRQKNTTESRNSLKQAMNSCPIFFIY
jgi:hypothetical protein